LTGKGGREGGKGKGRRTGRHRGKGTGKIKLSKKRVYGGGKKNWTFISSSHGYLVGRGRERVQA